jgi:hypothetical protein
VTDEELWEAFSTATLPMPRWTHREHLRIAWMYARAHPLDEAHLLMRIGIVRLNRSHELVETPSRGYHETITRAWLVIIGALLGEVRAETSDTFVDACGVRLSREALFRHYSRDRLLSVRARSVFVEPDLEPFPPARS